MLAQIESAGPAHCLFLADRASALRGFLVLDDLTLGPAAGGVRTMRYESPEAALEDALRLARSMTIKCALAGLSAGGGKAVLMDHPGLDRARAFEWLGARIEELGGIFRTAGDLGTTDRDLARMATRTRFVHAGEELGLAGAVARGLLRCIEVCAELQTRSSVAGLRIAVQGAGSIGGAVARALAGAGAQVVVADIDQGRARALAAEIDAEVCDAADVLFARADVLVPCATGGVVTERVAERLSAWGVCGAANNVLASPGVAAILERRGVLHVPDEIASAGAVIEGIGRTVMGLADRGPLIDRLGATAREVLLAARASGRTPVEVAREIAMRRIEQSRPSH